VTTPAPASAPEKKMMTLSVSQILSYCILGTIILVLAFLAWRRQGTDGWRDAGKAGGSLFLSVLPNLILGFTIAGFLQVLLPKDAIARWMGDAAGWRGLFAGSFAGIVTPGGPFTHFPILAGFMQKGAGVGAVSAYICGWAILGVHRIVIWEIPILGWKFVVARVLACLIFPPICGFIAGWIYRALSPAAG
jgi:uncharacterized membrane protein YraQ (UPF0718 family)